MIKKIAIIFAVAIFIFLLDQYTKSIFIDGFRYESSCIDLTLAYNKGVAFSMFEFLQEDLKYIQIGLVALVVGYMIYSLEGCYKIPIGILFGAAVSNIYDRFVHGGVVDMVYWHCGFDFAIFNLADVMIDLAVVWILLLNFKPKLCIK
ncbi:MAG: signal peptidase II [Sulfurimonas sp.]|jgi:signal peptidase II|nr:signal peptidase II [Sulfurimonadaceae bacterium]